MKGYEQFISVFGNITVLQITEIIIAIVFFVVAYKKFRAHMIKAHEAEAMRDSQLKEALEAVRKYPEYRQQSIEIQKLLEAEIQELRKMQEDTSRELGEMREQTERRERNKIRDRLLHNYRHYTNANSNPSLSWTRMEAEAFWELFRDYEDAGGDGYMHTVVQPEMERLMVIEMR